MWALHRSAAFTVIVPSPLRCRVKLSHGGNFRRTRMVSRHRRAVIAARTSEASRYRGHDPFWAVAIQKGRKKEQAGTQQADIRFHRAAIRERPRSSRTVHKSTYPSIHIIPTVQVRSGSDQSLGAIAGMAMLAAHALGRLVGSFA